MTRRAKNKTDSNTARLLHLHYFLQLYIMFPTSKHKLLGRYKSLLYIAFSIYSNSHLTCAIGFILPHLPSLKAQERSIVRSHVTCPAHKFVGFHLQEGMNFWRVFFQPLFAPRNPFSASNSFRSKEQLE